MSQLVIIVGPTATGKSETALQIAKEIGAEIVNADSMQVYKGMDIGTAKLPIAAREGIAHHLLDQVEVTEEVNVSWYQNAAREIIDKLLEERIVENYKLSLEENNNEHYTTKEELKEFLADGQATLDWFKKNRK